MEQIIRKNLAEECENYIKLFGANKNLYRIIPSMIDGLKPVQRRFLYSLYKGKGRTQFIKMAKAAADTTAAYHPHGSASVEDVGAKMASPIANNLTTVEGQGNFGSYKSDEAAASRYIECKLSKYALECFFRDFDISNVDMKPTYTGDDVEPEYLPAKYPHALINPQLSGIGYAFASNIPPFNFKEVLEATITLLKNSDAKILLIPDSPTGAEIVDDGQFERINSEGLGTFTLRGKCEVDVQKNIITITSIPLQTTIDDIIRKIVELREKKVFDEIKDIKDYSGEKHVRTLIYLDQNADPYATIEKLYTKGTGLKKTYPVGLKMVDDYRDIDYGVKSFLLDWISYRRDTVRSSFNSKLIATMEEKNINDALLLILAGKNGEETIKLARESSNKDSFAKALMEKYGINSQQASTISNMRIYAFTKDAYEEYKTKEPLLIQQIKDLEATLDDDEKIDEVIISQLKEGIKMFGSPRKSPIVKEGEEDEIESTDHCVAISEDGFIKKVLLGESNVGKIGEKMSTPTMVIPVNNECSLIIFDVNGRAYRLPVHALPDSLPEENGIPVERYCKGIGAIVATMIQPTKSQLEKHSIYAIFLTKKGVMKAIDANEMASNFKSMNVINVTDGDALVGAACSVDRSLNNFIIYTDDGNGLRKELSDIPIMKPAAQGSRMINLKKNESCVGFNGISSKDKFVLYVTDQGRAKVTEMKYFPLSKKKEMVALITMDPGERLVCVRGIEPGSLITAYAKTGSETIKSGDVPLSTRVAAPKKVFKLGNSRTKILAISVDKQNAE